MNNEHQQKVQMAQEVGKLLPETNDKVEHYKEALRADANLLNKLQSRQSSPFVFSVTKCREKIEIVGLKNSILQKQKIYESYLARKKKYEKWLDEMAVEVNVNFKATLEHAKTIDSNLRLKNSIEHYESREAKPTMHEKVEFYLYLKQEIENNKKHGKKKRHAPMRKT
jgi:hypothetical protein